MVELLCRCGQVVLRAETPKGSGTRLVCYCKDCRAAARLCPDPEELLTPQGGVDIWQTTPDRVQIVQGQDNLEILRLSPKGLMRWRTTCCGTPLCNMLEKTRLPFIGLLLRPGMPKHPDQSLGAVAGHVYTVHALPGRGAPAKDIGFKRVGFGLLSRMITTKLSGRGKQNPFLGADGSYIAPVRLADKAEVAQARAT